MIELIGWIGTFGFALCGVPPAYLAWKNKKTELDAGLLSLWFIGEVCTIIYVAATTFDIILMTNYLANFVCLCIILNYKLKSKIYDSKRIK